MKSLHFVLFVSLLSVAALTTHGQTPTTTTGSAKAAAKTGAKRGPVFRANKEQVIAAQSMLRSKGAYAGDPTGKLDAATRDAIRIYQKDNGLKATGTLNRATLEKMGIELTEKQKAIPASGYSVVPAGRPGTGKTNSTASVGEDRPGAPSFALLRNG